MKIITHRIYEPGPEKGCRVLVDRLWPRGITRQKARLDDWWKDLAPSPSLRTWFGHDPKKWAEFRRRYLAELRAAKPAARAALHAVPKSAPLVLLYAAKSDSCNHARILKAYLEKLKV